MEDLVKEIETFRAKQGLSQRKFAMDAGIDPATWNRIIKGTCELSLTVLKKLNKTYPQLSGKIISDFVS